MVQAHPSPPRMKVVQSAGAVVWRFRDGTEQSYRRIPKSRDEIEVLLVHRPRYNDWSWPKGKKEIREPLPTCAVREVEEETGYTVRLGAPLTTQRYRLGLGATKEVHYWVGFLDMAKPAVLARPATNLAPVTEIDKTDWVGVTEARARLARKGDKRLLEELLVRLDRQELFTKTLLITTNANVKETENSAGIKAEDCPVETLETGVHNRNSEEKQLGAKTITTISETTKISVVEKPGITPAMIAKKIQRVAVKRVSVQVKSAPSPTVLAATHFDGALKDSNRADNTDNADIHARKTSIKLAEGPDDTDKTTVNRKPSDRLPQEQRNLSRAGVSEVLRLVPLLSAYGVASLSSSSWRRALATCVPYATLSGAELKIRKELNPSSKSAETQKLKSLVREILLSDSGDPECVCIHPESLPPVVGEMAQVCPSWLVRRLSKEVMNLGEGTLMVLHLSYQPDTELPLKLYDLEIHPVRG